MKVVVRVIAQLLTVLVVGSAAAVDLNNQAPSRDTYLAENAGGSNYGSSTSALLGNVGCGTCSVAIALQYDLSSVPTNATVTTATLSFQKVATNHSGSKAVALRRHTASWTEGGATWNSMAPFSDAIVGSTTINAGLNFPSITDGALLTLVQEWVSNPSANRGMVITPGSTEQTYISFHTKESSNGSPIRLSISYTLPCTYSITPTAQTFTSSGGTGSVAVTAPSGCSWTASSNANWIQLTGSTGGSGNGPVPYSVQSNGGEARSGSISFSFGSIFNVDQDAAPPGQRSSLSLKSGTVAGQQVSPANRTIHVATQQAIQGSLTLEIDSAFPSSAVVTLGSTPTWGSHNASYVDHGQISTPATDLQMSVPVNLVAPSTPGTYHVIAAFAGEFNAAQVMSSTNWSYGSVVWDNGDDVASWSASTIATANANGTVLVPYLYSSGNVPTYVPATAITVEVSTPNAAKRADFNGDGRSDILLRNPAVGVAEWQMNGMTVTGGAVIASPPPNWVPVCTGDFNGDGKADVILQNSNTGEVAEWQMNGFAVTGGAVIASPGSSWIVKGAADFSGDGRADLVLRNSGTGAIAVWLLNGNTITTGAIAASPGTGWDIVALGDFNGDGRGDLVLQHSSTGNVAEWQMNGATVAAGAIIAAPGTAWRVAAAGDANGDGRSDLLLQHVSSGEVAVWLINSMIVTAGAIIASPGTAWVVTTAGDYDANGREDVLLRNSTTAAIAEWQLSGTAVTAGAVIATPGTAWSVVAR